ncbi:MAG: hypothetical protein AAGF73_02380 [Actinomycetota bacterium]
MDNTRGALYDALKTDPQLRDRFRNDPKTALAEWIGQQLPDNVEIVAVEDSPERVHVIIPPEPVTKVDDTVSDQELDAVSGAGFLPFMPSGAIRDTHRTS